MKYFLSLGAGVQSSALAVMFSERDPRLVDYPCPEAAIFADTQAEPQYVYDWLDMLESRLSFPVHRVSAGSLTEMIMDSCGPNKGNTRFAAAPFYVDTGGQREGRLRRQCTREFKVTPITQWLRCAVGLKPRQRAKGVLATQYLGISYDEAQRMKPSREKWIEHRWPLVDLDMRRLDCITYLTDLGLQMPRKSACTYCPYHDDRTWARMKEDDPESFTEAVRIDEHIRAGATGMRDRSAMYVHRSLKPLAEIDFDWLAKQQTLFDVDEFGEECEGMCGV